MKKPESGFDVQDPDNIAPTVVWLGGFVSNRVTWGGMEYRIKKGEMVEVKGDEK